MLSLKQNCEVAILRKDIPPDEWIACVQGRALLEQQRDFKAASQWENWICGDMSRVMASVKSNSEAMRYACFGRSAALCGDCDMMQDFLFQQREKNGDFWSRALYMCIFGSCVSGYENCLETCLQKWVELSKLDWGISTQGYVQRRMLKLFFADPVGCSSLIGIHLATFEWLSSKWSNSEILTFIDKIRIPKHSFDIPDGGRLELCCTDQNPSYSSILMSHFSNAGSLNGVQWLNRMGVQSEVHS